MARSNGIHSTQTGSRKKLVQPALPALSLLSRVNKQSLKAQQEKEQESIDNATAINSQIAPQPEVDSHVVTPLIEEEGNVQDIATPISPPLTVSDSGEPPKEQVGAGQHGVFTTQFEPEATVSGPLTPQHNISFNDTNTLTASTTSESAHSVAEREEAEVGTSESGELEPASTYPPRNSKALFGTNNDKTEDFGSSTPHTDLAPEAVTGHIEIPLMAHHAAQASVSTSSIQQTPKSAVAQLISPDSVRTHRHQESVVSAANAAPEVLANGHSVSSSVALPTGSTPRANTIVKRSFPTIVNHIRGMLNAHAWFDCDICIYYPFSDKPTLSFYRSAHSLVLIRSERLRNFIYAQRMSSFSYYYINLYPARPMNVSAFDAAIRFLYDDNILSFEGLFPVHTLEDKAGKVAALDYFMSYMVAGMELGIEPVVTRSLDLIGRILDWDLAELAVREAVALRSSSNPEAYAHAPPDGPHAARCILEHVFNLIVLHVNVMTFKVDDAAQPIDLPSRFAQFEGRAAVNPVLANMVFGSMPASAELSPSSPNESAPQVAPTPATIASTIMLNFDYEDLYGLTGALKRVYGDPAMRVISDVVDERERRRLNILNNRSVSNKDRSANRELWDIIGQREYVFDNNLRRERVSFMASNKRGGNK